MNQRRGEDKKNAGRVLLFVLNEAYFLLSHRSAVANAARKAGFEVHVATPSDHVWAPADFDISDLTRAGYCFHAIPLSRRGQRPWEELRTLLALVRLYRVLRPDIVHHLTIKAVIHGGLAARIVGVPAVVNALTGLGQVFVARGLRWSMLRFAVSRALKLAAGHVNSRVILQNPDDLAVLAALGVVDRDRCVLIRGSGVDLEEFVRRPEEPGPPLVVLAGRMIWEKGVGDFVEAARLLKHAGINARFALVGNTHPSNPRAVPLTTLQSWADDGIVEYWGRREDMADVLGQSHIVCLPSRYAEGVPRVLIEAAACGRPMVATDAAGCREVVHDGETGLLVPAADPKALAEAIAQLVRNSDLRAQMGARAREVVEAEFDERLTVAKTLDVYDFLLARAPRRAHQGRR